MSRFVGLTLLLATLLVISTTANASATYYPYNYSIDWSSAPIYQYGADGTSAGNIAKQRQNERSANYAASAYDKTLASAVYNNMRVTSAQVINSVSHGNAGNIAYMSSTPLVAYRRDGTLTTTYVSCMHTDGNLGRHGHRINEVDQWTNHVRDATDESASGARIVMYASCFSGASPATGPSLTYGTYRAVTPNMCTVGYANLISIGTQVSWDYQNAFWTGMRDGWSVGNSLDKGKGTMLTNWGEYHGYDLWACAGDRTYGLLP